MAPCGAFATVNENSGLPSTGAPTRPRRIVAQDWHRAPRQLLPTVETANPGRTAKPWKLSLLLRPIGQHLPPFFVVVRLPAFTCTPQRAEENRFSQFGKEISEMPPLIPIHLAQVIGSTQHYDSLPIWHITCEQSTCDGLLPLGVGSG